MKIQTTTKSKIQTIAFQDDHFLLTVEFLLSRGSEVRHRSATWGWPTLKFISFRHNQLCLRNQDGEEAYILRLQVYSRKMNVTCSCGQTGKALCVHALNALKTIQWYFGNRYFGHLHHKGIIALAFAHPLHFDKEESTAGIYATARPELHTVYQLTQKPLAAHLALALKMPAGNGRQQQTGPPLPLDNATTVAGNLLTWLILLPHRKQLLPAVIPCLATPNKAGTAISSWLGFQHAFTKQVRDSLSKQQQHLDIECLTLFNKLEHRDGNIIPEEDDQESTTDLSGLFHHWQQLWPLLQAQPLLYGYRFHGLRVLNKKPNRNYTTPLTLSSIRPKLSFTIKDDGACYSLRLQLSIGDTILVNPKTGISFMIVDESALYLLASLQDAAVVEWMHNCGGCLTIFKEHTNTFLKEILRPLRCCYTATALPANK